MSWLTNRKDASSFEDIFALRPNLFAEYERFYSLFWSLRPVDPGLLELCRLRMAQLLGYEEGPLCAVGLAEEKRAALDAWKTAPIFSDGERACLAFAEKFVLAPHSISDADAATVTAHLSAKEMVAFVEALAIFDGFTRFRIILGARPDAGGVQ